MSSFCHVPYVHFRRFHIGGLDEHNTWNQLERIRGNLALIPDVSTINFLVPEVAPAEAQRNLELKSIEFSLANLRSFPFVSNLESIGELTLHGYFL
jgi:hypothetical protein